MKVSEALCKPSDEVKQLLEGLYECSPWVADKFVKERTAQSQGKGDDGAATAPITTVTGLAKALKSIVDDSTQDEKMLLIRSHPDLCEKVSEMANLSEESQDEQSRAGLQSLTVQEFADFERNNAAYKRKFEFPFILAVRNATKYTVLSAMAGRLENSAQQEFAIAMQQVHKIAWMRILAKFESDQPAGFFDMPCVGYGEWMSSTQHEDPTTPTIAARICRARRRVRDQLGRAPRWRPGLEGQRLPGGELRMDVLCS
uniref:2-oxo-4-hydroxy-4-carboxy-5-ureidoimidazoline decarboxylase n=1 Tax=Craspedostauros australis TaxID=1486917 RepID=A0A7R9ZLV8_9STRA